MTVLSLMVPESWTMSASNSPARSLRTDLAHLHLAVYGATSGDREGRRGHVALDATLHVDRAIRRK